MPDALTSPPATSGLLIAAFAGRVRRLHSAREPGGVPTSWRSAIVKSRLTGTVSVGRLGIEGDQQKERKHHGGPSKAVLIYGAAHYAQWAQTLAVHAAAHADALRTMSDDVDASTFGPGGFGENLLIDGVTESTVFLGDIWRIGTCELQITEPRGPCATLARRWMRPTLVAEVNATAQAGWYNAVVVPGTLQAGDPATLISRSETEWSMARVYRVVQARVADAGDMEALRDASVTNASLRERLTRRLNTPGRTSALAQ
jgi:MOSC domain-containing protein YiiM